MKKIILMLFLLIYTLSISSCVDSNENNNGIEDDTPTGIVYGKIDMENLDITSDVVIERKTELFAEYTPGIYIVQDSLIEYTIDGNYICVESKKEGQGVFIEKKKAQSSGMDVNQLIATYENHKEKYEVFEDTDTTFKAIEYLDDRLESSKVYYEYKEADNAYVEYMSFSKNYKETKVVPCNSRKDFLNGAIKIVMSRSSLEFITTLESLKWTGSIYKNITKDNNGTTTYYGYFSDNKLYKLTIDSSDEKNGKILTENITIKCEYKDTIV